jgi:hypothetical protein
VFILIVCHSVLLVSLKKKKSVFFFVRQVFPLSFFVFILKAKLSHFYSIIEFETS